ncbi:MAG: hypothetical protein ABW166_05930 [Sedimenticola sp.]
MLGLAGSRVEKRTSVSKHAGSFLIDEQRNQLILAMEEREKVQF